MKVGGAFFFQSKRRGEEALVPEGLPTPSAPGREEMGKAAWTPAAGELIPVVSATSGLTGSVPSVSD